MTIPSPSGAPPPSTPIILYAKGGLGGVALNPSHFAAWLPCCPQPLNRKKGIFQQLISRRFRGRGISAICKIPFHNITLGRVPQCSNMKPPCTCFNVQRAHHPRVLERSKNQSAAAFTVFSYVPNNLKNHVPTENLCFVACCCFQHDLYNHTELRFTLLRQTSA